MACVRIKAVRATVLLLGILAGGCGPGAVLAQSVLGTEQSVSAEKLGHYIKGYNFLIGTFGLQDESRLYAGQQIARKTVNYPVNVSDGWIGLGNDELKQGQALPGGGLAGVDASAGEMIPVLDRLVERLKGLEGYYASRGQLEDNFARGKQEDPLVLADFKAAFAVLKPLNAALDRAIDRRDMANLLALKADGDMIGFNGGLALQQAKHLVELFHTPHDLHDPKVTEDADTLADAILAALADENTELATATASGKVDHALRNSNYGMAARQLQGLVGTYRDMKRSSNFTVHQMMVGAYNAAVESVNVGQ